MKRGNDANDDQKRLCARNDTRGYDAEEKIYEA
jgi:hypothetical protein